MLLVIQARIIAAGHDWALELLVVFVITIVLNDSSWWQVVSRLHEIPIGRCNALTSWFQIVVLSANIPKNIERCPL